MGDSAKLALFARSITNGLKTPSGRRSLENGSMGLEREKVPSSCSLRGEV
jgi:hypothetical protein